MAESSDAPSAPGDAPAKKAKRKRKTAKRKTAGAKQGTSAKTARSGGPVSRSFPKHTLETAIRVAKAIEEKYAGNPTPARDVAVAVGFKKASDWRFLDQLRAANAYGLVDGTGKTATVKLTALGADIVAPDSSKQRQAALVRAFRNVEKFEAVEQFYKGKRIPEDEYFGNTLTRQFKIERDRVAEFIETFLANLKFLNAFDARVDDQPVLRDSPSTAPESDVEDGARVHITDPKVREFLDSCFVMMPFGGWFDTYYESIYVPAIKAAGFEPIRADGLFSTGSVMEQIWEQINKAKVLLADLTGKNPNVFYELGLAHAARKPVVFTTGDLEDVPFDLRHLRVIVYQVAMPDWAPLLRSSITTYLKNARAEPEKSIPQPFRGELDALDEGDED